MNIELHVIQNFAPANLNRNDTGTPKDCDFGGFRRARISSQCFKRAMREYFGEKSLLASNRAVRTKRILEAIQDILVPEGKDKDEVQVVVKNALASQKIAIKDDGKSQYLIFVGRAAIENLAKVLKNDNVWDGLLGMGKAAEPTEETSKKGKKKKAAGAIPEDIKAEVNDAVDQLLSTGTTADIALFGRMLADIPGQNVDAACQVAHAISTNKVNMEFDFYTAVDDLNPAEETGAGMMGVIEFNSSCFYRYANIDLEQLKKNLNGDEALCRETLAAFVEATINAIPTGKQKSMAAQNPPSFVMAVLRDDNLWSLANAFEKPVRPTERDGLVDLSIKKLVEYWGSLCKVYGTPENATVFCSGTNTIAITPELGFEVKDTYKSLIKAVADQAVFAKST
ncbi:MAG TPA: type I-E CRISPR-associated protein Cas7/Cse4/CasC [Candidatus Lokiarchaeia archaeon]|nr:type I-E CRISPR-associated protein Cas7/Cse4/CasC [Candidatus Lokiarchaeia archaeon]